jgi:hypothetical protein
MSDLKIDTTPTDAEDYHASHKKHKGNHDHPVSSDATSLAQTMAQGKKHREHQSNQHEKSSLLPDTQYVAYRQTLTQVRKELPRSKRPFSFFIHTPAVEKISDILAATVFRPNAVLAGGVVAFLFVIAEYSYARYAGFALQGSETIIAFIAGWTAGIIFDIISRIFRGKQQN